jgi:hypothetical protein
MCSRFALVAVVSTLSAALSSDAIADATVNYQGYLKNGNLAAVNAFGIAGTFAPGFNPQTYHCTYGDGSCNLLSGHYSAAVADGNFIPIGPGDLTNGAGFFSGSGTTSAASGTPIYFFAFDTSDPDAASMWALATSTDPSFEVPAAMGATSIDTALTDTFIYGEGRLDAALLLRGVPIPEPSTLAFVVTAASLASFRRSRK